MNSTKVSHILAVSSAFAGCTYVLLFVQNWKRYIYIYFNKVYLCYISYMNCIVDIVRRVGMELTQAIFPIRCFSGDETDFMFNVFHSFTPSNQL